MFFTSLICTVLLIWMVIKIWKDSAVLAIASLIFWPALIFAVFKYWGDEDSDIKVPFLVFIPFAAYTFWEMSQWSKVLKDPQESLLWAAQFFV